ncbi:MAG: hypothetical protein A2283_12455 [Lentisphaerae bacterium RIFOXYA12_FULL_48_11]|nr:MAG: hypothetical protein A2283_12455 [Lentisphaerae bacterium RIFOXYA12_FULL_48_11]
MHNPKVTHKILHLISKFLDDKTAPEWMLLFAAGWGTLATGEKFLVDLEAFGLIQANIASRGNEVVFDYEHASLEKQAAPASGWIKELAWEDGAGIRARVDWTEAAAKFIAAKEYRYFSPVFYVRKSDSRVCGLDSVALTNRPKTTYLTPILAKLSAGVINKEEEMDRKKLIAALGLKDDATDAEILTAVATLGIKLPMTKEVTKEVVPGAIIAALGLKDTDDTSTIVAGIHALKQAGTGAVSRDEFDALQAKLAERDATDAVDAAMKTGKIAPAQKDWAINYARLDLKGFNTFVAMAPAVIPVNQLPGYTPETDTTIRNDAVAHVASLMGVDPADIKKYGEDTK